MRRIVNNYLAPYPDLGDGSASLLAVLTADDHGNLTAFSAIVRLPPFTAQGYADARHEASRMVMLSGMPDTFDRAKTFWPYIKRRNYTEGV